MSNLSTEPSPREEWLKPDPNQNIGGAEQNSPTPVSPNKDDENNRGQAAAPNQNIEQLREQAVRIAYKAVPLPSGCSNCWGDLGEGCTDECRNSSDKHSEKIDETVKAITNLITSKVNQARINELEAFRTNTGQYEIERNYATPTGQKNWNADIKARNKLRASLDKIIEDRLNTLKRGMEE